jgi:hypothetical protein
MKRLIPQSLLIGAVISATTLSSWADEDSFSIAPTESAANPLGNQGTIAVTAPQGANWTAESLVLWITINGSTAGAGNGTVSYTVDRNSGAELRKGTIHILNRELLPPR